MRRNMLNFVIDTLALLVMLAMVGTGLVIRYLLPPGSGGRGDGQGLELWNLGRHDWGDIHFWLAMCLIGLAVVHVALHWSWVCGMVRRCVPAGVETTDKPSGRTQNLWGLVFLFAIVLLVGGFIWLARARVISEPGEGGAGRSRYQGGRGTTSAPIVDVHPLGGDGRQLGGRRFHGSMTLREAADEAGVSVERVRELLSLPGNTPAEEHLGQLGRQYGFDMRKARTLLERLGAKGTDGNVGENQ